MKISAAALIAAVAIVGVASARDAEHHTGRVLQYGDDDYDHGYGDDDDDGYGYSKVSDASDGKKGGGKKGEADGKKGGGKKGEADGKKGGGKKGEDSDASHPDDCFEVTYDISLTKKALKHVDIVLDAYVVFPKKDFPIPTTLGAEINFGNNFLQGTPLGQDYNNCPQDRCIPQKKAAAGAALFCATGPSEEYGDAGRLSIKDFESLEVTVGKKTWDLADTKTYVELKFALQQPLFGGILGPLSPLCCAFIYRDQEFLEDFVDDRKLQDGFVPSLGVAGDIISTLVTGQPTGDGLSLESLTGVPPTNAAIANATADGLAQEIVEFLDKFDDNFIVCI